MRFATLLLFALLPLQWLAVGSTPLGQGRLHQLAMICFAGCVLAHYRLRVYAPVLRSAQPFLIANIYLVLSIAVLSLYRGDGLTAAVQYLLYLLVFVAVGGFFYRVGAGLEPRILRTVRMSAVVVCASLLIGLSVAMLVNGVNPAGVLARTIAAGDPEIFQKELFKSAFAGFGLDDERVQGNLRHEIFGSVLLSMLISTWAMRVGSTPSRREVTVYRAAIVVGVGLLALSLSRSVLIAAMIWPALAIWRSLRRAELSTRQVATVFGSLGALGILLVSGLGAVIANRFLTDTSSYEARASLYEGAFGAIPDYWIVGGFDTADASSHNFLVDTLLRNGIFALVPAVVIMALMLAVFGLTAARLAELPSAAVTVVAAIALPLVRAATSGGGLIPPIEWVALGFVAGALAALRHRQPVVRARDRVTA